MKILNSYKPGSKRFQPDMEKLYSTNHNSNPFIFLLRHGQIQGYKTKRFTGQTDVPLDQTGMAQAVQWQKAFFSIKFTSVYSSSLKRCSKTAQTVFPKSHIHLDPNLNEINLGSWDGKTFAEIKKNTRRYSKKEAEISVNSSRPEEKAFRRFQTGYCPFSKILK